MALVRCEHCDGLCDPDHNIMEEGPDGGLWCENCLLGHDRELDRDSEPSEAQEWYDYDPEC